MPASPDPSPSLRPRGVVAVAARDGRYLAIRRGPTVAAGGRICFPGGHVESGEAEAAAIERECREELGATVEATARVWSSETAWGTALSWWTVRLVAADEFVPHPVEVAEILWLSEEEMLADPDLLPGNREFLLAVRSGVVRLDLP